MKETIDCGCTFWTEEIDGEKTMVFIPHDIMCKWYLYFLDELKAQGKPLTVVDGS